MDCAWAPLDDLDFSDTDRNRRMYLNDPNDPNDPAGLDLADTPTYPWLDPHEYNGLTWFGDTILMTYTGSDSLISYPNKTMIWSTRVDWIWQQP